MDHLGKRRVVIFLASTLFAHSLGLLLLALAQPAVQSRRVRRLVHVVAIVKNLDAGA